MGSTAFALLPFTNRSTRPCNIAPDPAPIAPSSTTPALTSSASALYPRSLRFCNIAVEASCTPSAVPVTAILRKRFIRPTASPPSFSMRSVTPGILIMRPIGSTSREPMAAPRRVAEPRSSSVAPAARARSLASPAPAPTPSAPATPRPAAVTALAGAANAAAAAGAAIPAIEPIPDASL